MQLHGDGNGRRTSRASLVLLVAALLIATTAQAANAVAHRVKDINQIPATGTFISGGYGKVGQQVMFTTVDGGLWKTGGTPAGTELVKELRTAGRMIPLGEVALFHGSDGSFSGIWKSDGTPAGTLPVASVDGDALGVVQGALLLVSYDLESTARLWRSDGTETGTAMIGEFPNDTGRQAGSGVFFGDSYYFEIDDFSHGVQIWKTDGSAKGSMRLRSFPLPAGAWCWGHPVAAADGVFFTADDGAHGCELWKTDGTTAGTQLVKDVASGADGSSPFGMTAAGRRLFYLSGYGVSGYGLWVTDGTADGTMSLARFTNISGDMTSVGDTVFFEAWSDAAGASGLFKSDGTPQGTVLVKQIAPEQLRGTANAVYFAVCQAVGVCQLWKSDGSTAGTTLLKDWSPGTGMYAFAELDGRLFISADDGVHGLDLWTSDGTPGGTSFLGHGPPANRPALSTRYTKLAALGETLFFFADDRSHGGELWKSDGTEGGTVLVKDVRPGAGGSQRVDRPQQLVAAGGKVFFLADDGVHGLELWKSDGTEDGTSLVKDVNPGSGTSGGYPLTSFEGKVYWPAADPDRGFELWRSDGTEGGTDVVRDIAPGAGGSLPQELTVSGGALFFAASDPDYGCGLFRTDGTATGTVLVKAVIPHAVYGCYEDLVHVRDVEGTLFFLSNDRSTNPDGRYRLWKSDGTTAGTVQVAPIGAIHSQDEQLFGETESARGLFFVSALDEAGGWTLWRSDGTAQGTYPLRTLLAPDVRATEFAPGSSGFGLMPAAGELFFRSYDSPHGWELWETDGTIAGTALVRDIADGPSGSYDGFVFARQGTATIEDKLLFSASDGSSGFELWRSDGTGPGTSLVQDIAPGPRSSRPNAFKQAGRRVFFVADDGESGVELWSGRASIVTGQPRRAVQDLASEVRDLGLPGGTESSLLAKLDAAGKAIDRGAHDAAARSLDAFMNEVNAQRGKKIPAAAADELSDFARETAELLGN